MNDVPEWANWVARDVDRDLYVFNHKPEKIGGEWITWTDNGKCKAITGELKESFNDVKWTDEEPTLITHELNSLIISNDLVNKPNHYKGVHGLEMREVQGNFVPKYEKYGVMVMCDVKDAFKYVGRAPDKNGVEDIDKAIRMMQYAREGMVRYNETVRKDKEC